MYSGPSPLLRYSARVLGFKRRRSANSAERMNGGKPLGDVGSGMSLAGKGFVSCFASGAGIICRVMAVIKRRVWLKTR